MALSLRPITPSFGVEVLDVDLSQPLSEATQDEILDAYYRHSLLLFRGQSLTPERQSEITQGFGTAKKASKIRHAMEEVPIISRIGNIKENGEPTAFLNRQGVEWHSDGAGAPENDIATFLYAVETPDVGGDTMFCSMHVAYDTLPPELLAKIEGRQVTHDFLQHNDKVLRLSPGAFTPMTEEERARIQPYVCDLVQTHPVTGRKLYFISHNLVREISGLTPEETEALTWALVDHATVPERVHHHKWRVGDLTIWDNRALMHSATAVVYDHSRRLMHRSSAQTHPERWMARRGTAIGATA